MQRNPRSAENVSFKHLSAGPGRPNLSKRVKKGAPSARHNTPFLHRFFSARVARSKVSKALVFQKYCLSRSSFFSSSNAPWLSPARFLPIYILIEFSCKELKKITQPNQKRAKARPQTTKQASKTISSLRVSVYFALSLQYWSKQTLVRHDMDGQALKIETRNQTKTHKHNKNARTPQCQHPSATLLLHYQYVKREPVQKPEDYY